jgi:hypothetical protein
MTAMREKKEERHREGDVMQIWKRENEKAEE